MRHRALDSNGDWTFGKGANNFATGLAALQLNIETRIRSWLGDCFFAEGDGVDYNNLLDVGTKSLLDSSIQRNIIQTEGVLSILSYNSTIDRDTRDFTVETRIATIYGVMVTNLPVAT